jgi:hypothetical protein
MRVVFLFFACGASLFLFTFVLLTHYPTITKDGDYSIDDIKYSEFVFLHAKGRRGRGLIYVHDDNAQNEFYVFSGGWHFGMEKGDSFCGGHINYYERLEERPIFVFVEQDGAAILDTERGLALLNDSKKRLIFELKLYATVFFMTLLMSPFIVEKKLVDEIIHNIRN